MTQAKPTAQLLLVAETGDPLLAISRYGLGKGMGYTSDLTERWGGRWLAWDDCGRFWAQALRGVVRHADTEGLHVNSRQDFDVWNLSITRTAKNGAPVTDVNWDASALDENGRVHDVTVDQIGLGRYRTRLPLSNHQRLTTPASRLRPRQTQGTPIPSASKCVANE